ncbi:MAG: hypothetical protein K8R88_05740 [Armatimonadetes bacterium]|nr:hypothetical protein [Armatimonadota bacterium]
MTKKMPRHPYLISCLFVLVLMFALLGLFWLWQQKVTHWVQLSEPPGYTLRSVNGDSISISDGWTYLPEGPTTFVFTKESGHFSYTVFLRGGGEVYLGIEPEDLVPMKVITGT